MCVDKVLNFIVTPLFSLAEERVLFRISAQVQKIILISKNWVLYAYNNNYDTHTLMPLLATVNTNVTLTSR